MKYLNILSPIFVGVIAFLTISVDHIWRDKRTNVYNRIKKILIASIIIAVFINVIIAVNNESMIKNLNTTISNLTQKVATLENQNNILSILNRMASYISNDYESLSKKYPNGYYLFATNKYTIIPSNTDSAKNFTLDWENCKVNKITDSFLHIILKSFTYLPKNIKIEDLNIILERKVGTTADGIFMNHIGLFVELLDERKDELVYVIGFKMVEKIPEKRELDQKVKIFKEFAGIKGALISAFDTNISEYITMKNFILTSGWKVVDN
ncbi:MAG: hypothetical protein AB1461_17340 [Thermodesulfobacteriota bacterium]